MVLLVLGMCALQALVVDHSKRVAACKMNKMQRFLHQFYSSITCIPILHMAPWSPLLKKVRKEGGDEAELVGRQTGVGAVVLHQQSRQAIELGRRLTHPLEGLYVGEDRLCQQLVSLPDAGKLGADVAVDMAPAHQPCPHGPDRVPKDLLGRPRYFPGTIRHVEARDASHSLDKAEICCPGLCVLMGRQRDMREKEATSRS